MNVMPLGPKGRVLLCCHIVQVNFHHDLSHISKLFFFLSMWVDNVMGKELGIYISKR
jgi:hypothetical protein